MRHPDQGAPVLLGFFDHFWSSDERHAFLEFPMFDAGLVPEFLRNYQPLGTEKIPSFIFHFSYWMQAWCRSSWAQV